jgi:hypothetical protein
MVQLPGNQQPALSTREAFVLGCAVATAAIGVALAFFAKLQGVAGRLSLHTKYQFVHIDPPYFEADNLANGGFALWGKTHE